MGKGVLKGHCHAIVVSLQKAKTCQPKTNGLVFFAKDYITALNVLLSSVVTGDEDGNRLKLEKISQFFQVLKLCLEKIASKFLWFALPAKFYLPS